MAKLEKFNYEGINPVQIHQFELIRHASTIDRIDGDRIVDNLINPYNRSLWRGVTIDNFGLFSPNFEASYTNLRDIHEGVWNTSFIHILTQDRNRSNLKALYRLAKTWKPFRLGWWPDSKMQYLLGDYPEKGTKSEYKVLEASWASF